jgi:hypothetical protein
MSNEEESTRILQECAPYHNPEPLEEHKIQQQDTQLQHAVDINACFF